MNQLTEDALCKNEGALKALADNDYLKAQNQFKDNAVRSPCFLTIHNLGVYYIEEGYVLHTGKKRSAVRLGIEQLKKAESIEISSLNLAALANAYHTIFEFKKAIPYYERSAHMVSDYMILNNYGVALYLLSEYDKASMCFSKAIDNCHDISDKQDIVISYAYATLAMDKVKCHDIISNAINSQILDSQAFDTFVLSYLCGDLQSACKISNTLFKAYRLESPVVAMILDCHLSLGLEDEALKCLHYQIESLNGYDYNVDKEVNSANKAFIAADYRKKLISEYNYTPPIIAKCFYYGCDLHNPMRK